MSERIQAPEPAETLPVPRRSWVKMTAFGIVLLLCGMVIGSGLTVIGFRHRFNETRSTPEFLSDRILAKMQQDLKLTNAQKNQIQKIFKDAREDRDEMRQRYRVQAQAFFHDVHDKVSQVLTPAQQKDWDDWWRKARERANQNAAGGQPRSGTRPGGAEKNQKRFQSDRYEQVVPGGDHREPVPPAPDGIPEHHVAPPPSQDAAPPANPQAR